VNTVGPRGNRAALEADADDLVRRYLALEVTLEGLARDYRVAYATLVSVIHPRTTPDQRADVAHRRHVISGTASGFQKGNVPWTKGLKGIHMSPATEFKKGHLCAAGAKRWRPVGTIVQRRDRKQRNSRRRGKLRNWIKVRDDGPPRFRWVPLARHVWEQAHGPIPKGMLIIHRDGDQLNDALSNLQMVDRNQNRLLQQQRDPTIVDRLKAGSSKASKQRHRVNRARKAKLGPAITRWECPGCGNHIDQRTRPDRCPKCGGGAFEKLRLRAAG